MSGALQTYISECQILYIGGTTMCEVQTQETAYSGSETPPGIPLISLNCTCGNLVWTPNQAYLDILDSLDKESRAMVQKTVEHMFHQITCIVTGAVVFGRDDARTMVELVDGPAISMELALWPYLTKMKTALRLYEREVRLAQKFADFFQALLDDRTSGFVEEAEEEDDYDYQE